MADDPQDTENPLDAYSDIVDAASSPEPSSPITPDSNGRYNIGHLQSALKQAGWNDSEIPKMSAIGWHEGAQGDPRANRKASGDQNPSGLPEDSVGPWQINWLAHKDRLAKQGIRRDDLFDPVTNAKVALDIYNDRKAKGRDPYSAWGSYGNGKYKQFLPLAKRAYQGSNGSAPASAYADIVDAASDETTPDTSTQPSESPYAQIVDAATEPQQPTTGPASLAPLSQYDTKLSPEEEGVFHQWKQKYAPNDTGEDYDLRGAFKAGLTPDPKTGHWPDTFKKPNHPTFSNQSQYAVGPDAAKAGIWEGDTFVPPNQMTNRQKAQAAMARANGAQPPAPTPAGPPASEPGPFNFAIARAKEQLANNASVDRAFGKGSHTVLANLNPEDAKKVVDFAYAKNQTESASAMVKQSQDLVDRRIELARIRQAEQRRARARAAMARAQGQAPAPQPTPQAGPPQAPPPAAPGLRERLGMAGDVPSVGDVLSPQRDTRGPVRPVPTTISRSNLRLPEQQSPLATMAGITPLVPQETPLISLDDQQSRGDREALDRHGIVLDEMNRSGPGLPPLAERLKRRGIITQLSPDQTLQVANATAIEGFVKKHNRIPSPAEAQNLGVVPVADRTSLRAQIRQQLTNEWLRDAATPAGQMAQGRMGLPPSDPNVLPEGAALEIEQEVDRQMAEHFAANTPEMIAQRKSLGSLSPAKRVLADTAGHFGGGVTKFVAGVTDAGGIVSALMKETGLGRNQVADTLNNLGNFYERASSLPPLDQFGNEVVRGIPERTATWLAETGIDIGEIVLLRRSTGLPLKTLLPLITALKTTDQPLNERSAKVAESGAYGVILDQHLSRPLSALVLGGPAAIRNATAYSKGQKDGYDAILDTVGQSAMGFVLGGKGPKEIVEKGEALARRTAYDAVRNPILPDYLRSRLAEFGGHRNIVAVEGEPAKWNPNWKPEFGGPESVVKHGELQPTGRALSLYTDLSNPNPNMFGEDITATEAERYADRGVERVVLTPEEFQLLNDKLDGKGPRPEEPVSPNQRLQPATPQLKEAGTPRTSPLDTSAMDAAREARERGEQPPTEPEQPEIVDERARALQMLDRANQAGDDGAVRALIHHARQMKASTDEIDEVLGRARPERAIPAPPAASTSLEPSETPAEAPRPAYAAALAGIAQANREGNKEAAAALARLARKQGASRQQVREAQAQVAEPDKTAALAARSPEEVEAQLADMRHPASPRRVVILPPAAAGGKTAQLPRLEPNERVFQGRDGTQVIHNPERIPTNEVKELFEDNRIEEAIGRSDQVVPPSPETPRVPELPETIKPQMEAMVAGRRPAVILPVGSPQVSVPAGVTTITGPQGETVLFRGDKLDPAFVQHLMETGQSHFLIGMPNGETPAATVAAIARDANGVERDAAYLEPGNEEAFKAAINQMYPDEKFTFEFGGKKTEKKILKDRTAESPASESAEQPRRQKPEVAEKPVSAEAGAASPALPAEPSRPTGLSTEDVTALQNAAYALTKTNDSANTDLLVHRAAPEVGRQFDAHGIAKVGTAAQLKSLTNLLDNGIDPNRPFHTAPLELGEGDARGAQTAGGIANHNGSFIVLGAPGQAIKDSGIKYVLVNDAYYDAIPQLQEAYPQVEFIRADQSGARLAEIVGAGATPANKGREIEAQPGSQAGPKVPNEAQTPQTAGAAAPSAPTKVSQAELSQGHEAALGEAASVQPAKIGPEPRETTAALERELSKEPIITGPTENAAHPDVRIIRVGPQKLAELKLNAAGGEQLAAGFALTVNGRRFIVLDNSRPLAAQLHTLWHELRHHGIAAKVASGHQGLAHAAKIVAFVRANPDADPTLLEIINGFRKAGYTEEELVEELVAEGILSMDRAEADHEALVRNGKADLAHRAMGERLERKALMAKGQWPGDIAFRDLLDKHVGADEVKAKIEALRQPDGSIADEDREEWRALQKQLALLRMRHPFSEAELKNLELGHMRKELEKVVAAGGGWDFDSLRPPKTEYPQRAEQDFKKIRPEAEKEYRLPEKTAQEVVGEKQLEEALTQSGPAGPPKQPPPRKGVGEAATEPSPKGKGTSEEKERPAAKTERRAAERRVATTPVEQERRTGKARRIRKERERRKAAEDRAFRDKRSGLANADAWDKARTRIDKPDSGKSVVAMDLRNFKVFNEVSEDEGHAEIKRVGDTLNQIVSEFPGSQAFRSGGDEFRLEGPTAQIEAMAERVREMHPDRMLRGQQVGMSVGTGKTDAEAVEAMKAHKATQGESVRPAIPEGRFEKSPQKVKEVSAPASPGITGIEPQTPEGIAGMEPFPAELGSLGIPRAAMPQIDNAHRGAMVQFLKGRGIDWDAEEVAPDTLKPTQAEYSPAKVEQSRQFAKDNPDKEPRKIIVSSDNYVIDAHHQWKRDLEDEPKTPIPILRLHAPAQVIMLELARFPSSGVQGTHHEAPVSEPANKISSEPTRAELEDQPSVNAREPTTRAERGSQKGPAQPTLIPEAGKTTPAVAATPEGDGEGTPAYELAALKTAFNKYDDTGESTFGDLVNDVERISEDANAPAIASLIYAVETVRDEQRQHAKQGYRLDGPDEEVFLREVQSAIKETSDAIEAGKQPKDREQQHQRAPSGPAVSADISEPREGDREQAGSGDRAERGAEVGAETPAVARPHEEPGKQLTDAQKMAKRRDWANKVSAASKALQANVTPENIATLEALRDEGVKLPASGGVTKMLAGINEALKTVQPKSLKESAVLAEETKAIGESAKVVRFEAGKKLTDKERRQVLKSIGDSYVDLKAPKVDKGMDRRGEEIVGYQYDPDYMFTSDITGRKIRHYIRLPDGKKAHPSELFPDITEAEVNKALLEAANEARSLQAEADLAARAAKDTVGEANADFRQRNYSPMRSFEENNDLWVAAQMWEKDGKFYRAPKTANKESALSEAGWKQISDPSIPQAEPEVSGPKVGQVINVRGFGDGYQLDVKGVENGKVMIGQPDSGAVWKSIPVASFKDFVNDLEGRVDIPADSDNPDVNAVAAGKGTYLGRGDDGIVFRVGDNVVKVSTGVPYVPTNPGDQTPEQAVETLRKQVETSEAMRAAGIPGILPSTFVEHAGKGFQIKLYVEIPESMTAEQVDQVRKAMDAMEDAGYALHDQLQAGLLDGKVYLFDVSKADKFSSRPQDDTDDDNRHFLNFAARVGQSEALPLKARSRQLFDQWRESKTGFALMPENQKIIEKARDALIASGANRRTIERQYNEAAAKHEENIAQWTGKPKPKKEAVAAKEEETEAPRGPTKNEKLVMMTRAEYLNQVMRDLQPGADPEKEMKAARRRHEAAVKRAVRTSKDMPVNKIQQMLSSGLLTPDRAIEVLKSLGGTVPDYIKKEIASIQGTAYQVGRRRAGKPVGRPRNDPETNTLEQQVRAYGGVTWDKNERNRGEIEILRESGKKGLVDPNGISAEAMARKLAEDSYGMGVWWEPDPTGGLQADYGVDGDAFIDAVQESASGSKPHHSTMYNPEMVEHPDDLAFARLEESEAGNALLTLVQSGRAKSTDIADLTKLATETGLSDEALRAFLSAMDETLKAQLPEETEAGEGYTLDDDGNLVGPDGRPLFAKRPDQPVRPGPGDTPAISVTNNLITLHNEAAVDLLNKAVQQIDPGDRVYGIQIDVNLSHHTEMISALQGVHSDEATSLANIIESLVSQGHDYIRIESPDVKRHEDFHEQSRALSGNASVGQRHSDAGFSMLNDELFQTVKPGLEAAGYTGSDAYLIEELAAYLADGAREAFGINDAEWVEYWMTKWFDSFGQQNGYETLLQFKEMDDEAERAKTNVLEARLRSGEEHAEHEGVSGEVEPEDETNKPLARKLGQISSPPSRRPQQLGFVTGELLGELFEPQRPASARPTTNPHETPDIRAYGRTSAGQSLLEAVRDRTTSADVKTIAAALEKFAYRFGPGEGEDFIRALDKLATLRDTKTPIQDFLNQGSFFGQELTDEQQRLLVMFDRSAKGSADYISRWTSAAADERDEVPEAAVPISTEEPTQGALFQKAKKVEPVGQPLDDYEGKTPKFDWDALDNYGHWTKKSVAEFLSVPADKYIYRAMVDLGDLSPSRVEKTDAAETRKGAGIEQEFLDEAEAVLEDYTDEEKNRQDPWRYRSDRFAQWSDYLPHNPDDGFDDDDVEYLAREMQAQSQEDSYPEEEFSFSSKRGFPPIVITRRQDGSLVLNDGNHRADIWSQQGFSVAPAWVNDELARSGSATTLSLRRQDTLRQLASPDVRTRDLLGNLGYAYRNGTLFVNPHALEVLRRVNQAITQKATGPSDAYFVDQGVLRLYAERLRQVAANMPERQSEINNFVAALNRASGISMAEGGSGGVPVVGLFPGESPMKARQAIQHEGAHEARHAGAQGKSLSKGVDVKALTAHEVWPKIKTALVDKLDYSGPDSTLVEEAQAWLTARNGISTLGLTLDEAKSWLRLFFTSFAEINGPESILKWRRAAPATQEVRDAVYRTALNASRAGRVERSQPDIAGDIGDRGAGRNGPDAGEALSSRPGEPITVTGYHGSRRKGLTELKSSPARQWGDAIYFATSPEMPTEEFGHGGQVYKAEITLRNPFLADTAKVKDLDIENTKAWRDKWSKKYDDADDAWGEEGDFANAVLRERGYDGVIASHDEYGQEIAVFNPESVKLETAAVDQTDTPEFQEWAKGTKVVDKDGKPLAVYHGTPHGEIDFTEREKGTFFTDKPSVAGEYTTRSGMWRSRNTQGAIYPVYLSLQNPLEVDADGTRHNNILVPWQEWKPTSFGRLPDNALTVEDALAYAKERGHDGLIVRNVIDTAFTDDRTKSTVYAVVAPEQIKSATGNRGTFDPETPSILEQRSVSQPQTETPEFQRWFKGSKIADESGVPLVVYHGTRASEDFDEFSTEGVVYDDDGEGPISSGSGPDPTAMMGAHFAKEPQVANKFAQASDQWMRSRYDGESEKPRVIPVYLSIKNPRDFGSERNLRDFIFDGKVADDELLNRAAEADGVEAEDYDGPEAQEWFERYDTDAAFRREQNTWLFESYRPEEGEEDALRTVASDLASDAVARLQAEGHDGVIYKNIVEGGTGYIAFDPKQIKSAIGNRGTFDPESSSILEMRHEGEDEGPFGELFDEPETPGPYDVWANLERLAEELEEPGMDFPTGLKNAITDAEREAAGLDPIIIEAQKVDPFFDMTRANFNPVKSASLAKSIADAGRPHSLSATETSDMIVYKTWLRNEYNKASDLLKRSQDAGDDVTERENHVYIAKLDEDLLNYQHMSRLTGYEWGLVGRLRQELMEADYSLADRIGRAEALYGAKLPPEVKERIIKLIEQRDAAVKALEDYDEKASQRAMEAELAKQRQILERRQKAEEKQGERRERTVNRVIKRQEATVKFQSAAERYRKWKETAHFSNPFLLDPDLLEIIKEMFEAKLEEGLNTVADIIDPIYQVVQEEGSERDLRDALSGYGRTIQPSKEEIDVRRNEIKTLMRDISALEDIEEEHIRPSYTGFRRPKPSQRLRESKKRVAAALRKYAPEIEKQMRDPEEMQASALDRAKTVVRNRIEDLNSYIAGGERAPKRPPVTPDAELLALQEERDRLQKVLDAIEGPSKLTDEEKIALATKAAERSIAEYERRLREGDFDVEHRTQDPWSQELGKLKRRQAALAKVVADQRKAAKNAGKPTKEERRLDLINKSIDKLEARIKSGAIAPKPRPAPSVTSPAIEAAEATRKTLQKVLADLRRAAQPRKPPKTEAEKQAVKLQALRKRLADREAELLKTKAGVIGTPRKSAPLVDPQSMALRTQIKEVEEQIKAATPAAELQARELDALKHYLRRRDAELAERIRTKSYSKKGQASKVKPTDLTILRLQADIKRKEDEIDREERKIKLAKRNIAEKILFDYIVKARRAIALSSTWVIGKLTMAAYARIFLSIGEEVTGAGLHMLPVIGNVARRAPSEGRLVWDAEIKAITTAFSKEVLRQMVKAAKTGKLDIDLQYGKKKEDVNPSWMEFIGHIHLALKTPAKLHAFERYMEKNLQWFGRLGYDPTDQGIIAMAAARAIVDANRAIFQQDNFISNLFANSIQWSMRHGFFGKTAAGVMKFVFPITRVAPNFVLEAANYTPLGGVVAAGKLLYGILAYGLNPPPPPPTTPPPLGMGTGGYDPYEGGMPPELADSIIRGFKKSGFGLPFFVFAVLSALGLMGKFIEFGGFYKKGEKRKKGDVPAGGVRVMGHDLPTWMTHIPLILMMQAATSAVKTYLDYHNVGKDDESVPAAAFYTTIGALEEVPFYEEPARALAASEGWEGFTKYITDFFRGMTLPPDLQRIARVWDPAQPTTKWEKTKELLGFKKIEAAKRKPEGGLLKRVGGEYALGIPGLRNRVSGDKDKAREEMSDSLVDDLRGLKAQISADTYQKLTHPEGPEDRTGFNQLTPQQQALWFKVSAEIQNGINMGVLLPGDARAIGEKAEMSELQYNFKNKNVVKAMDAYERMTPEQQVEVFDLLKAKGHSIKDLRTTEQKDAEDRFRKLTSEDPSQRRHRTRQPRWMNLFKSNQPSQNQ